MPAEVVVRVPGYRSIGSGSIPDASFFFCLTKELTELNAKPSWNFP
jgi:hypothetical protein